ncbi:MAG TPA: hypothetical protein VLT47_11085 [Anaeromyxobacteraceae bacterium]|nr:hypothetical protein [Anaeromyxobacteraceae bacterium]
MTNATKTTTHTRWCTPGDCHCEAMAEIRRLSSLPMGKGREIHGRLANPTEGRPYDDTANDGRGFRETVKRMF